MMDAWTGVPLEEFGLQHEVGEDGRTTGRMVFRHGDGEAQRCLARLAGLVREAYEALLSEEEGELYEREGKVPVLRAGRRSYETIDTITLGDLPAVLDTLQVLEEESKARSAEEAARLADKRKARRRRLDRERRKRKKLGEW
jgi:hypothetical protein